MKTKILETLLRRFNCQEFDRLESEHHLASYLVPGKTTPAARLYRLSRSPETGGSLLHAGQEHRCFHGKATGAHGSLAALERLLNLSAFSDDDPAYGRVAVGALIDGDKDDLKSENDLPVVLVVGINYGQHGTAATRGHDYLHKPPGLYDDTGMTDRLEAVVRLLVDQGNSIVPVEKNGYHLVATNFFPWITTKLWKDCTRSVLAEELLLRYFGWPDPLDFVTRLVQEFYRQCQTLNLDYRKGLTHVIFHGAQNAAMRCGLSLTSQFTRDHSASPQTSPLYSAYRAAPPIPPLSDYSHPDRNNFPGPDVIFCDNLAPSRAGTHFYNAVWLWQQNLRGDTTAVLDEEE